MSLEYMISKQITPKTSHIALHPNLVDQIKEMIHHTPLNKTTFDKELALEMAKKSKIIKGHEVVHAVNSAKLVWDMGKTPWCIRDFYGLSMVICLHVVLYSSTKPEDYDDIRVALSYSPTIEDITKYNSLKYTGTRTPYVFTKEAPQNTKHILPAIILEQNAMVNRLMSICGKDTKMQCLVHAYLTNPDRRGNIMFYICHHIDKPSLISALSYIESLNEIEDTIQNFNHEN